MNEKGRKKLQYLCEIFNNNKKQYFLPHDISTHRCAYQRVRNVSFSEHFVYIPGPNLEYCDSL